MSDLIDRQQAIDDIWTVSPLAHLDREWIDRWLRQLPPANCSETPNSSDTISRQAVKDILDKYQLRYHIYPYVWDAINELPPAQPERVWHPVEKPPAHHKDVIVRGVEAIGNVTVHKVMQWDVDTWRPTDYAPSIMWTEWSEI